MGSGQEAYTANKGQIRTRSAYSQLSAVSWRQTAVPAEYICEAGAGNAHKGETHTSAR